MVIAISEKRMSATRANTTPGLAKRVARRPPSKAIAGQQDADRGDRGADRLEEGQRLAPEDHRQDDGQPAERRDHPADDRDRADLEPGEVGEVGARADDPEQRRRGRTDRASPREGRPGDHEDGHEQDGRDELHARRHPQAADDAGCRGR